MDPSNLIVAYYLGEAYFASRRYSEAIASFEKAIAHSEFRADAYYYLSKALGSLSKQAMERLGREYPDSFYIDLARAHFHEGREGWEEAERAYREALKKRPDAPGLEERLRWVSASAAQPAAAGPPPSVAAGETTMLALLYLPPPAERIDALLDEYRSRVRSGTARRPGERSLYRLAEDSQIASYLAARWIGRNDPGSYRQHQLRAQLHESRGQADDAVSEYRAALRLKPDLQNVHFAMGSMLWSLSRFDEARSELEAELRINSNHPEAHYVLADILQLSGRRDEAKTHLLEALRLDRDFVEAHLAIERIYFAEGQLGKALEELRIAARLSPADPAPHYRMSMVHRRLGNLTEAREAMKRFRRLQTP